MQKVLSPVLPVTAIALVLGWGASVPGLSATMTQARPEEVGLSSERLQRVSEFVKRHIAARNFPGAVTLVARQGRVAHFEAHGLADLDSKRPMQVDAAFRIASMTKPIIGVAIMMLVEEGRIHLTDPVSKFIPELKQLQAAVSEAPGANTSSQPRVRTVPADREITIRDLLTHTSGVMSGPLSSGGQAARFAIKEKDTLADYVPRLASAPLEFQPGTRWAYSPLAGFDVLARIVEVVSEQPVDRFLRTRIFEPLGMPNTRFYPVDGSPPIVTLYEQVRSEWRKRANPTYMNGAYFSGGGGLVSTAEDYWQFAEMLLEDGQLDGKRLLSPRAVALMTSAFIPDRFPGRQPGESFGLAVRVVTDPVAMGTFLSRGSYGWSGGYNTHFWIDPSERLIGIFLAQTSVEFGVRQEIRTDFENTVMQAVVARASAAR